MVPSYSTAMYCFATRLHYVQCNIFFFTNELKYNWRSTTQDDSDLSYKYFLIAACGSKIFNPFFSFYKTSGICGFKESATNLCGVSETFRSRRVCDPTFLKSWIHRWGIWAHALSIHYWFDLHLVSYRSMISRGVYQLPRGCTNISFCKSFPENYMKMEKKWMGGAHPPGSVTAYNVDNSA